MSDSSDNQDPEGTPSAEDAALAVALSEATSVGDDESVEQVPIPRKSIPPPGALLIPMPKAPSRIPPPPSPDMLAAIPALPAPPLDPSAGLEPVSSSNDAAPEKDRGGPPPKPFSRAALKPPTFQAPPPAPKEERPPVVLPEPSLPPSMPTTERLKEAAASIRPARMIKLGEDSPRSARPDSAVERVPSSHPAAEPVPPPLPDFALPPPPAFGEDLKTLPRQPIPPPPEDSEAADEHEEVAELSPETDEAEAAPKAKPPKRPPPRSRVESKPSEPAPDLDQTPTPTAPAALVNAAEGAVPPPVSPASPEPGAAPPTAPTSKAAGPAPDDAEHEPAPDSGEDRVSLEDAEPVSTPGLPPPRAPMQTLEDGTRDDKSAKKPPPPPKRSKSPSLPGTETEPPRTEAPSQQRAKRWWEELFTEDFGRTLFPLTPRQVGREVDFIEESLGVAKGGIVLDLGCGAGHHAVELSSRGYGVVGLDLSLLQLMIAADNAQERGQKINFLQADMRDMSFDSVFDGVYSWDTSFGYFEEDKNTAVVERVFRSLRPGGNFLLDVINRDFVVEHQPSQVWFEGDACVCMDDMSVDFITSRLRVKRTLMLDDGRSRELIYSMRIYSLHELGKILHGAGFRVIEASGHIAYPGTFLGATSPRVMILAQKP